MPERPYRTNDDMKIIANRSKSADGRLHQAFKSQDPKLSSFHRGTHYIVILLVMSKGHTLIFLLKMEVLLILLKMCLMKLSMTKNIVVLEIWWQ